MRRKSGCPFFWRLLATASLGTMLFAGGFIAGRMSLRQSNRALELQLLSLQEELNEWKSLPFWPVEQPTPQRTPKRQLREIEEGMKADELEQWNRWTPEREEGGPFH